MGRGQYAEVLVNGKTGTRHIPLFSSVPYIKELSLIHTLKKGNKNTCPTPSLIMPNKNLGNKMKSHSFEWSLQQLQDRNSSLP